MDAELAQHVRKSREGDIQAFSYVVAAFQQSAMAWARAQTQGEHAAEDAVADAFVLAFSKLAQLREIEAFAGWLQALVRTCCLRQLRRKLNPLDEGIDARAEDPPEDAAVSAELRQAVRGAVGELREGQRAVIERHYLSGQKLEEIARELNLPLGTVKRRLFEAREKLRTKLIAFGGDDVWRG